MPSRRAARALFALGWATAMATVGAQPSWYYGGPSTPGASDWPHSCDADTFYDLSAFYADTYQRDQKLPQGCRCKENGQSDKECTLFDCDCVCDLTAGQCDLNCCCDAECGDEAVARFVAHGDCLPEGGPADFVTKCYSTDKLEEINPTFPMTGKETARAAIDDLLCVEYDNSAYQVVARLPACRRHARAGSRPPPR